MEQSFSKLAITSVTLMCTLFKRYAQDIQQGVDLYSDCSNKGASYSAIYIALSAEVMSSIFGRIADISLLDGSTGSRIRKWSSIELDRINSRARVPMLVTIATAAEGRRSVVKGT